MSLIPEQISAAAQTQLSNQLDAIQALSNATFGGLEKLIALHLNTVKQSLDTVSATTQQLLAASTPQELLALTTTKTPPPLEAFLSYGREIADISINARATFFQAVNASGVPVVTTLEFNFPPQKDTAAKSATPTKTSKKTSSALVIDAPANVTAEAPVATPANKTPAPEQKLAVEKIAPVAIAEKQLPLLTETESSKPAAVAPASTPVVAKPPVAVVSIKATTPNKATVNTTPVVPATAAPVVATPAKPVVAATKAAKPAAVKSTPAATSPAAVTPAKPVNAATVKPVVKAVTSPAPAPAAEKAVPEKKSAVKFPFPPSQKTQNGKPALASTKPAYKAKASAATGAKKPVRQ